jgi:hypothetical protein
MFNNLRSLAINDAENEVDIKLLLPKMKSLHSLALGIYDNEYLDYIYTQCRSLHTFKFNCEYMDDIFVYYFERMIESIKSGIIERDFPLTLVLDGLKIQTAVKVMKRLEEEREVSKQI